MADLAQRQIERKEVMVKEKDLASRTHPEREKLTATVPKGSEGIGPKAFVYDGLDAIAVSDNCYANLLKSNTQKQCTAQGK